MTFETERIVSLAREFLSLSRSPIAIPKEGTPNLPFYGTASPDDLLLRVSQAVSELSKEVLPSARILRRAGELFDTMAAHYWETDWFGERNEICSSLAFLAWRHASGLGMSAESQEWLRVSDVIANEPFAASESIEAFFELSSVLQTPERAGKFFRRADDVFLALASLRRDGNSSPKKAAEGATLMYAVCLSMDRFPPPERQYLLGEAAWIAGNGNRYLGRRSDSLKWLSLAARHFGDCNDPDPLLAKTHLAMAILARDSHDLVRAKEAARRLASRFASWNMNREVLVCEFIECLVDKETGAIHQAIEGFKTLVDRLRKAHELVLLSAALAPYAELAFKRGDTTHALQLLAESLDAASGCPIVESTTCVSIAESHLELGNLEEALFWCRAGVAKAAGAGCTAPVAYYRVWLADLLLRSNQVEEAYQELMLALPVLKTEQMIPESLKAADLLSEINSRGFDSQLRTPLG